MSDKKLTQGTYYSCQHQELNNNKCSACDNDGEREREREREREQFRTRSQD